jgi:hypothetical protein
VKIKLRRLPTLGTLDKICITTKLDNHMTEAMLLRINLIHSLLTWSGNQLPKLVSDTRENGLWDCIAKPEPLHSTLLPPRTTLADNVSVKESTFA